MANCYEMTRTNYFGVTDEEKFMRISKRITEDSDFCVSIKKDSETGKFAIIAPDGLRGIKEFIDAQGNSLEKYADEIVDGIYSEKYLLKDSDWDESFEFMCRKLQEVLSEDDAIIFTTLANEEIKYLSANIIIVTKTDDKFMALENVVLLEAQKMLGNPNWTTKACY